MNVLDLFSGIGGFSLGLERAGMRTVAFCEVDKFCREVLRKNWPQIPILQDITQIGIKPMSSAEASHAKTSATQANAPDYPGSVLAYGNTFAEPFAWFDQSTQSWRTWQRCLVGGWERYAATWPRSGMTRNGIAYRLPPLVQNTNGTEFGLLPTLTVCGNYNRKGASKTSGDGIVTALRKLLPTLCARDYRGVAPPLRTAAMRQNSKRGLDLPTHLRQMNPDSTGSINPSWAEGYMGYPIGHTELRRSEMPSSRKSQKSLVAQSCKPKD